MWGRMRVVFFWSLEGKVPEFLYFMLIESGYTASTQTKPNKISGMPTYDEVLKGSSLARLSSEQELWATSTQDSLFLFRWVNRNKLCSGYYIQRDEVHVHALQFQLDMVDVGSGRSIKGGVAESSTGRGWLLKRKSWSTWRANVMILGWQISNIMSCICPLALV